MNRLRVAAHVHTTWSFDGTWPLRRLARALGRRGYDVMLTSEHCQSMDPSRWEEYQRACARESANILVVPGVEYRDAANTIHVPTWGPLPYLGDRVDIPELLQAVHEHGGVAVLAHPGRRQAWRGVESDWFDRLAGVEVWNRKYDGWAPSRKALWLATQAQSTAFVALDFHGRRQFFPLSMVVEMPHAPTRLSVEAALRDRTMQPHFLGQGLHRWLAPWPHSLLRRLEGGRRRVAPFLRKSSA